MAKVRYLVLSGGKKCTTEKLRVMIYSADKTEDLSPEHLIPYHSERLFQRGRERRARVYGGFYNEDQILGKSKDYC